MLKLLLPVLRADLAVVETCAYTEEPPFDCHIGAFVGGEDSTVIPEAMAAWRAQTRASFALRVLPGDHFFLIGQREALLEGIAADLRGAGGTAAGAMVR